MSVAKRRTVEVEIPEIQDLPIDDLTRGQIDMLCQVVRENSDKIKEADRVKSAAMDNLRPLVESQGLPERVLGSSWDLRKTKRVTSKVNEDKLKIALLGLGFRLDVECPKTQVAETADGQMSVIVCPQCNGAGRVTLEEIPAVKALLAAVTDVSESVSWSVYARKQDEAEGGTL